VEDVATVLLCRTDAQSAQLLTSDIDERDHPFITGERTAEGFFRIRPDRGVDYAIARSLAYAPYADLLWWETSDPNLADAERFADAIHREFPGKMLAYNCSPSFNWQKKLAPEKIAGFQRDTTRGVGADTSLATTAISQLQPGRHRRPRGRDRRTGSASRRTARAGAATRGS